MAFTASAVLEVQTGGSDSTGVGVFDPGVAGMDATGSVASANTSAPVVTVNGEAAGDVNMWFYLKSATNSVPGWYPITAVDTVNHTYTLNAAIGAAVLANFTPNTAVGCCSSGTTLSSVTWAVDFSQTTGNIATGTVTSAAAVLTATTAIFRKPMIGNGITQGTAWRVIVGYTSTTVVTLDASPTWTAVSASIGGALASPGSASSLMTVQGVSCCVKSGTYTIANTTANTSGGPVSLATGGTVSGGWTSTQRFFGYGSIRGDRGTKPIFQAASSGVTSITVFAVSARHVTVENISVDGQSKSTIRGFSASAAYVSFNLCKGANCTNSAFAIITGGTAPANNVSVNFCEATGCATQPAFLKNVTGGPTVFSYCVSQTNTITGFQLSEFVCIGCMALNNTGSTSVHGFDCQSNGSMFWNCTSYGNAGAGYKSISSTNALGRFTNCIAEANGNYGWLTDQVQDNVYLENCAGFNNTTANYDTTQMVMVYNFKVGTASFFVSAAGGNFALNNTAGGGASCRAAAIPGAFPGLATTIGYLDIGAVQSQAVVGEQGSVMMISGGGDWNVPVWTGG